MGLERRGAHTHEGPRAADSEHQRELEVTLPAAFDLLWRTYFAVRGVRDLSHKDRWRWLDQHHDAFGSELTSLSISHSQRPVLRRGTAGAVSERTPRRPVALRVPSGRATLSWSTGPRPTGDARADRWDVGALTFVPLI